MLASVAARMQPLPGVHADVLDDGFRMVDVQVRPGAVLAAVALDVTGLAVVALGPVEGSSTVAAHLGKLDDFDHVVLLATR